VNCSRFMERKDGCNPLKSRRIGINIGIPPARPTACMEDPPTW